MQTDALVLDLDLDSSCIEVDTLGHTLTPWNISQLLGITCRPMWWYLPPDTSEHISPLPQPHYPVPDLPTYPEG